MLQCKCHGAICQPVLLLERMQTSNFSYGADRTAEREGETGPDRSAMGMVASSAITAREHIGADILAITFTSRQQLPSV